MALQPGQFGFDPTFLETGYTIEGHRVTNTGPEGWRNCFGTVKATAGQIHTWTLQISGLTRSRNVMAGVAHSVNPEITTPCHQTVTGFMYNASNDHRYTANCTANKINFIDRFESGMIIQIILDLTNTDGRGGILSFSLVDANHEPVVAFSGIPMEIYRLAIETHSIGNQVTILDHSMKFCRGGTTFRLPPALDGSVQRVEEINTYFEELMNDKDFDNLRLEDVLSVESRIQPLCDQIATLATASDTLMQTLERVRRRLQERVVVGEKDWRDWSQKNIVQWMSGLEDGRFWKYNDVVMEKLVEQNIHARHLSQLTTSDLYCLGITDFEDRRALSEHLGQFS